MPTPTRVSVLLILQTMNVRGERLTHTFITVIHFYSLSCSSISSSFLPFLLHYAFVTICLMHIDYNLESCWANAIKSGLALLLKAPLNFRKSPSRLAKKFIWTQLSIAPICVTHPVLKQAWHNVTLKCVCVFLYHPSLHRVEMTSLLSCPSLVTCREDDTTPLLRCIPLFLSPPPLTLSVGHTLQRIRRPNRPWMWKRSVLWSNSRALEQLSSLFLDSVSQIGKQVS